MSTHHGAAKAFDFVEKSRKAKKLSYSALAISLGMTPSTVIRTLSDRSSARWTPTLLALYNNALNANKLPNKDPIINRLAIYSGPGEHLVKQLLRDVDGLIVSLQKNRN